MPWYRDPQLLPALFGLVGVILGGIITAVCTFLVERSKEKRSRNQELRRAARTLLGNLMIVRADMQWAFEHESWNQGALTRYVPERWEQFQSILAGGLSDEAWDKLVVATMTTDSFTTLYELSRQLPAGQRRLGKDEIAAMQMRIGVITAAMDCLTAFLRSL
jgi:hypothetical protein